MPLRHGSIFALTLAAVAALAAPALAAGGSPTVLLGARVGKLTDPDTETQLKDLENTLGRKLAIDNDIEGWTPDAQPVGFPDVARVRWDIQNGRIPMLSWMVVFNPQHPRADYCATVSDIAGGRYDDQLKGQARALKDLPTTVLVRWAYELGSKASRCLLGGLNQENDAFSAGPAFVAAWRHIVDLFRKAGVRNVQWVWSPGSPAYSEEDGRPNDRWKYFYPGAGYVDWIAVDHYNKTMRAYPFGDDPMFRTFYKQAAGMGKPLMLAETAANSDPNQSPDPQTVWLTSMRESFPRDYPAVKAVVYWDVAGVLRMHNGHEKGAYGLTDRGIAAFKQLANDPYFTARDVKPYFTAH